MRLRRRRFNLLAVLATLPGIGRAATTLADPALHDTLGAAARRLFPHDQLADERYRSIAIAFADANAGQARRLAHALGAESFAGAAAADQTSALRAVEHSADFQTFRMHTLMQLYSDPAVSSALGYGGPSLAQGGYIERGFDDIRWLDRID